MSEADAPGLPAEIVSIDALRIARGRGKTCYCRRCRFLVDTETREVTCQDCGARVDAFDAMRRLCSRGTALEAETNALLEQRRALLGWQPRLVALRELEKRLHERKMVPSCPHCYRGLLLEDFGHMGMTNREIEVARRKGEGGAGG